MKVTTSRTAYKIGFSASLSADSISAYHDAADHTFANKRVLQAFFRGYRNGLYHLHEVKRDITNGTIVFVRDSGVVEIPTFITEQTK